MIKRKYEFELELDDDMITKRQKDLVYANNIIHTEAKLSLAKRKNETMLDIVSFFPKKYKQFDNLETREFVINVEVFQRNLREYMKTHSLKISINPHVRTIDLARKIAGGIMVPPHHINLVYRDRRLVDNELLFDELFDSDSVVGVYVESHNPRRN